MATWAARRKAYYLSIFFGTLVLVVGVPLFLVFYHAPTCFDGKLNGSETGVDCGGKCARLCPSDFIPPLVQWARFQKVSNGVYNLGAYIENANSEGGVKRFSYLFRVYDNTGILIAERRGTTYVAPHKNRFVFEPTLITKGRIPNRVTFEFTEAPQWEKIVQQDDLAILEKNLTDESRAPRLSVLMKNNGVNDYGTIEIAAVLYDEEDNVVAFSRTKIDEIKGGEKMEIPFTWPLPFERSVARIEIIPTIAP